MSRKTGKPTYTRPAGPSRTGRVLGIIGGLAAALLVGVLIGTLTAQPGGTDAAVAELRRQEAARDTVQITELTARARDTGKAITPVIEGLAGTGEVDDAQLARWRQAVAAEVAWFAKTVSGATATNVARGGLRNAVEQLAAAVETFAAARALPASSRQPVLAAAARQRELAVMAWSVAATQLDQINVDAGHGHQHVYLEIAGISGLMAGDSLPEGTGH
ncbi:hypothetical protein CS0771_57710 [Catellatospora sp. IY07-71]|uniref:hypothetical protein n=1 Tax=Catellatospora sp. IY07-71 TaxID=2728827 RepID=UPI001BB44428|nr:hypothetical protein [Catellatospora sp. IY07-71]BCJ76227.1 hypothetical protein CS0771_57710 [Catellatospora sp. IY07-71]